MRRSNFKRANSGQVFVVTSLLVALLLLSTAIYVIQTEKEVPKAEGQDDSFQVYEQSLRNTVISALANLTDGGNVSVLTNNLNELQSVIASYSYQATLQMDSTPLNSAPYQNGVWLSWATNGQGVSSAYVSTVFNSSGFSASSCLEYNVNVTSQIAVSGTYSQLNDSLYQVNLTINVLNEGKAALAQNFTFNYENAGSWLQVSSPSVSDFGNATYAVSFNAQADQQSTPIVVSTYVQDERGIVVGANVTCTNVQ